MNTSTGLSRPNSILESRGILESAMSMAWTANGNGWEYPIPGSNGNPARWKAFDSNASPKYRWLNGYSPKRGCRYYHAPDIQAAIKQQSGLLHIVNGEPSVLAMLSAGIRNALSWYGESSIPKELVDDLRRLEVKRVRFYPDNDKTGFETAQSLTNRLANAVGIQLEVLTLANAVQAKGDINDLWIAMPRNEFQDSLTALPLLELEPVPTLQKYHQGAWETDESLVDAITAELRKRNPSARIKNDELLISSPFRQDRNPSFSYNIKSGLAYDHATGQGWRAVQLARGLGIEVISNTDRAGIQRQDNQTAGISERPLLPGAGKQLLDFGDRWAESVMLTDAQYVSEAVESARVGSGTAGDITSKRLLAVRSAMGSGKTWWLKGYVESLGNKRIAVVSPYRALTRMTSEQFNAAHYDSKGDLTRFDKIAICAPSIGQIAHSEYDCIIIDEVSHYMAQLSSPIIYHQATGINAVQSIRHLCANAKQVILTDAHLTRNDLDFFANIMGLEPQSVGIVDNRFKPAAMPITRYQHYHSAIESVLNAVQRDNGVVFVPCGSNSTAKAIRLILQEKLGLDDYAVGYMKETSNTKATRKFSRKPKEIEGLRAFIYTTSFGTGLDFTGKCAAVIGIFDNPQLTPQAECQMLFRARHAASYGYWQLLADDTGTANFHADRKAGADKLLDETISLANTYGNAPITDAQIEYETVKSNLKAFELLSRENRKAITGYLLLLQGFQIQDDKTVSSAGIKKLIDTTKDSIADSEKESTTTQDAMSDTEVRKLERQNQLSETDYYANLRYAIETCIGTHDKTTGHLPAEYYDDFHKKQERARFKRFCLLMDAPQAARDKDESQADYAISNRKFYQPKLLIVRKLIQATFGMDRAWWAEREISKDAIESSVVSTGILAGAEALGIINTRNRNPRAFTLAKQIFKHGGIWLEKSGQQMVKGKRVTMYRIDWQRFAAWETLRKAMPKDGES